MNKKNLTLCCIFGLFFFPSVVFSETAPLLGIVVDFKGKVCLKRESLQVGCIPLELGTRVRNGDVLLIQKKTNEAGKLVLLDWKTKNRVSLPEGEFKLQVKGSFKEKGIELKAIEKQFQKILRIFKIVKPSHNRKTAASGNRKIPGELEECLWKEKFPDGLQVSPSWLHQCLSSVESIENIRPPQVFRSNGRPLPQFSSYYQLPENITSTDQQGNWILSSPVSCTPLKSPVTLPQLPSSITYLAWPYQGEYHLFTFLQVPKTCKENIQKFIRQEYKPLWPDENTLEYHWMVLDLLRENKLNYQALLKLEKIRKQVEK